MPSVQISSICGDMPALAPFDRENPPDVKDLRLALVRSDPSDGTRVYSNGCYAFAWYDGVRTGKSCLAYAACAKGLMRVGYVEAVTDPDRSRRKGCLIDVKPVKAVLHELDLASGDAVERLVLMKTLADLDGVMEREYGLRILDRNTKTAFLAAVAGAMKGG